MKNTSTKLLFTLTLIFTGLISCSNDDYNDYGGDNNEGNETPEEKPYAKVSLEASKSMINIYEWTKISISLDYSSMVSHDSVVWELPGIYTHVSKDGSFLYSMSQTFNLPGHYKFSATAFKNGEVLASDTAFIEVTDRRDFLGINWNSTESIKKGELHFNSEVEGYYLPQEFNASENPYNILHFVPDNFNYEELAPKSRKLFYDYITDLYEKAKFTYEGTDVSQSPLTDEYNNRFVHPLGIIYGDGFEYYPLAIWETSKSNIALIAYYSPTYDESIIEYLIIAEPRR